MGTFFTTLIVGISLSMDAFSLALVYGTQNITFRNKVILSVIVGLYHFFMPLLGLFFGGVITKYLIVNVSILVSFIFIVIGIEMIISNVKEKDNKVIISLIGFLVFGFSVSIDSFTTGIGLNVINSNYLEVSLIFSIVSGSFTYFGLILGNRLKFYFGRLAASVGGIVLIMLGIYYFFR